LRLIGWDVIHSGNIQVQLDPSTEISNENDLARILYYSPSSNDMTGQIKYGTGPSTEEVWRDYDIGETYTGNVEIRIDENRKASWLLDDTNKGTSTNAVDSGLNWRIRFRARYGNLGDSEFYVNTAIIRKYASTEPSFTNFGTWTDVSGVSYSDSGIRYYDGTAVQAISMYSDATTSALRFYDGTNVKHIPLVATNDANASPIRVYDGTEVKALRKQ